MDLKVILKKFFEDAYPKIFEEGLKLTGVIIENGEDEHVVIDDQILERLIDAYMIIRCLTYNVKGVHVTVDVFKDGDTGGNIRIEGRSFDFEHPEMLALAIQKSG